VHSFGPATKIGESSPLARATGLLAAIRGTAPYRIASSTGFAVCPSAASTIVTLPAPASERGSRAGARVLTAAAHEQTRSLQDHHCRVAGKGCHRSRHRHPAEVTAARLYERLGGSLRQECLDFLIPVNECHLKMTFKERGESITIEAGLTSLG
jgi:hypothetical protein